MIKREWKVSKLSAVFFSLTSLAAVQLALLGTSVTIIESLLIGTYCTLATLAVLFGLFAIHKLVAGIWSVNFPTFIGITVTAGLGRGYFFWWISEYFLVIPRVDLLGRLSISTLTTVFWLVVFSYLVEGRASYLRRYRALYNQMNIRVGSETNPDLHFNFDALENIVSLKTNLGDIATSIGEANSAKLIAASEAVRQQIDQVVRPLSHRIWYNDKNKVPQFRLAGVVSDAVTTLRFSLWRLLIVQAAFNLIGGWNLFPPLRNLINIIFPTIFVAFIALGFNWFRARKPGIGLAGNVLFLSIVATVPFILTDLIATIFGFQSMVFPATILTWLVPITLCILFIVDSSINLIQSDRVTILTKLEQTQSDNDQLPNSGFATYLHNSIQSELTGIAFKLEQAGRTANFEESKVALEQLGAFVSRSISEDFRNFHESPVTRLANIKSAWEGIASIDLELGSKIEDSPKLAIAVQMIEEIVTNSVRSGGARHITARIMKTGDDLEVEVEADGTYSNTSKPGLGTELLSAMSISNQEPAKTSKGFKTRIVL